MENIILDTPNVDSYFPNSVLQSRLIINWFQLSAAVSASGALER